MASVRAWVALLMGSAVGCGGARHVSVAPDGGVVAIPADTNCWPFHHRDCAERMMAQRCPGGYQIEKEEATRTACHTEWRISFKAKDLAQASAVSEPR